MATIKSAYVNARLPGAYSGLRGFMQNRSRWKDKKEVAKEFRKINSYTLHKDLRRKFKRRHVKVFFKDFCWASDLKDISNVAEYNNNNNFILIVLDIFSKKAYTRLLKTKSANSMIRAFKSILKESGTVPMELWTDHGKEYVSAAFKEFLAKNNIHLYHTSSPIKSAFAENFIRNFYGRISRYMTEKNTFKFENKLEAFTRAYNNTYHNKIKRTPNSVTKENEMEIWREFYLPDYQDENKRKPKFNIGERV